MRSRPATAVRSLAVAALATLAVFLIGAGLARAQETAEVETLEPIAVDKRSLTFDVEGIQPSMTTVVTARTRLRAHRPSVQRILRRHRGHPVARHRARRRMRHRLHRRLRPSRVEAAAEAGQTLEVGKPKWAKGGHLTVRTDSAPNTKITEGTQGTITTGSASFSFSSNQSGSTFDCQLDGQEWSLCASPKDYSRLADGSHVFAVRAVNIAGIADETPATRSFTVSTSPPPSTSGPPSGTVVQADYVTRACPIDGLWGAVSDAYYYTTQCSNWSDAGDPQIDYSATGGSPLPGQDGQVHSGYRRLRLTDGKQSIYDATCSSGSPCNSSYRTQAISGSDTRTFYPMKPGHRYVWWISVRFQNPTPLTGDTASDDSQIWQIKNQGSSCHPVGSYQAGPIESMTETKNTIRLISRQRDGDLRVNAVPIGQRGVWQAFAFDVYYTNDPAKAAYRLWGDQNGDSKLDLVPLTPKITGRVTAVGPDCIGKPSIGPYQPMSVPAVSRDYGTNEMVEVPVGASWG